jgi:polysaccharide export outer membrane protein
MKFSRFLLFLFLVSFFVSCKPVQQLPYYLDKVNDSTGKGPVKAQDLRIQKNDLMSIQISSLSTKPEVSDLIYNQPSTGSTSPGYLVDNNGNIEHHRLGVIHAEGLNKQELATEIKKRLTIPVELLKEPTVVIRFMNFKVTVLGEVGQQGPVTVPGERLTILEAIGLAGGVTDYGKKDKVLVVREINGQRETGYVDLSSDKIFESPFYNLVQNDLLIVGETNRKLKDSEQARITQKVSFALTLVTVAATLYNVFRN